MTTKKEIIKLLKSNGFDEDEINEAFDDIEALPDFAETEDIQAALVARKFGIPLTRKPIIKKGGGGGGGGSNNKATKLRLCDVKNADVEQSHIIIAYINRIETRLETSSGKPKTKLGLVEGIRGKCKINASLFMDALESFNEIGFSVYDRIKFDGANIFDYDYKGHTGKTLTCGMYTGVHKLKGTLMDKMPSFEDAKKDSLTTFKGMVLETYQSSYNGCPDCGRKAKDNSEYIDSCQCGFESGMSKEIIIYHAGITDGISNVSVTIFPSVGVTNDDIAFKPVTIVGYKKSDNELTAISVTIEGTNEKDTRKAINKKSKTKSKSSKMLEQKEYDDFTEELVEVLDFYEDGHPLNDLVNLMKRKMKDLDEETITSWITKAKKQGLITINKNIVKST